MINYVEMTNWRLYEHHEMHFSPGITFLMGPNGVGKTSILEAVAYALTGEPSTVTHRGKLLRDPSQLATVRLSFTVDGKQYLVQRSQSHERADKAQLLRASDNRRLASSHKHVTAKIEDLMGVSADFLQRIVYMAEGDVFRFLNEPPGRAVDSQIRHVLGLTQLDEFVQGMAKAQREIRDRVRALQRLLQQMEQMDVHCNADLEQRLHDTDASRGQLLDNLRSAQQKISEHRRENEDLLRLTLLLDQALPSLRSDAAIWQRAQDTPVLALYPQLEQELEQQESAIQKAREDIARLDGERGAHQRTIDILLPYAERTDTLPCPVCRKPMTRDERQQIMQEVQDNTSRISEETSRLKGQLAQTTQARDSLDRQIRNLNELRNVLAHVGFRSVSAEATATELQRVTMSQRQGFQDQVTELEREAAQLEDDIAQLEAEKAESLAVRRQLQSQGYQTPEEAREALVALEVRALSLRAANSAAQMTLAAQRNVDLTDIYDQIARVWQAFLGEGDWSMQLDPDGNPLLEDRHGRQFDLSQFSGGEKTALLVILHTIIAHHFSQSDFLLVDEPLEHLDPVNRRSLVRFLVDAYQRNMFSQAIVATFEESLIRKYMSEDGVNVIHL